MRATSSMRLMRLRTHILHAHPKGADVRFCTKDAQRMPHRRFAGVHKPTPATVGRLRAKSSRIPHPEVNDRAGENVAVSLCVAGNGSPS